MPHDIPLLKDLLILLLTSIPVAFICHRLRLPLIIGFILTGALIGPFGLGLISELEAVEALAEIGVVLLLFTIGLEFSLRRIIEMKRLVLLGGGLQVLLTLLLAAGLAYLLDHPIRQAIFLGFLASLSSTAIVLKSYIDRAEVNSPHGRLGVGILLFQDLCLVPMMLLLPILGGKEGSSLSNIIIVLGIALSAVVIIALTGRYVVPWALYHIVRLRSPEIFIIFVVLLSVGTSWLTSQFGLSLALGAFIAGLVLSESEYSHQIVADILPFRDVFNSIFFISIGMLLSIGFLAMNLFPTLALVVGLIIGKSLIVISLARQLGYSLRVATTTGLGLAQVGEFSFILAKAGVSEGLLLGADYQQFLAASVLSMIATPFLIGAAPRIGYKIQSVLSPDSLLEPTLHGLPPLEGQLKGHVIIVGYGLNGHNVARVLRTVGISYLILELNAELVREANQNGEAIYYGDATRREVLHRIRLESARVLVIAISDPIATRRTVALAREMNPDIHIIVRTRYMSELQDLDELGANQVIPEEFETSIEIFSRVLQEYGIARSVIQRQAEKIRQEGYLVLRLAVEPRIELTEIAEALASASTETLIIEPNWLAVGKTIAELDLRRLTGATIIATGHEGSMQVNPGPDYMFAANDIVVLLGGPDEIESAIEQIIGRIDSEAR